jgi:hypothetical protein
MCAVSVCCWSLTLVCTGVVSWRPHQRVAIPDAAVKCCIHNGYGATGCQRCYLVAPCKSHKQTTERTDIDSRIPSTHVFQIAKLLQWCLPSELQQRARVPDSNFMQ